jgi:hypothetical protein
MGQEGTQIPDSPPRIHKAIILRGAAQRFLQAAQGGRAELGGPSWTGRIKQACPPTRQKVRPPHPDPVGGRLEQLSDVAERPSFGE